MNLLFPSLVVVSNAARGAAVVNAVELLATDEPLTTAKGNLYPAFGIARRLAVRGLHAAYVEGKHEAARG